MTDAKFTLGYWDIRGLAEPIRIMMEYCGVEYEDKRYSTSSRDEWMNDKKSLNMDFPNLPYLVAKDENLKMSQSQAILVFLCQKYGLMGKTDQEKAMILEMLGVAMDFRMGVVRLVFNSNFENAKENYAKSLPTSLERLDSAMEKREFAAGNEITAADFLMIEALECIVKLLPDSLQSFPNVRRYLDAVYALPQMKYLSTSKHTEGEWHAPSAHKI